LPTEEIQTLQKQGRSELVKNKIWNFNLYFKFIIESYI
jgi:hypothetical protein